MTMLGLRSRYKQSILSSQLSLEHMSQAIYNATFPLIKLVIGLLIFASANASAQTSEWTQQGFVSLSGGGQFGNGELQSIISVPKFDELAELNIEHNIGSGGVLDFTGGVRLWRNIALGIGFSLFEGKDEISGNGSVPNPLFFDRHRDVAIEDTGPKQRQIGIHFSAVYVMPLTDRIIVSFSGGPTVFNIRQGFVSGFQLGPETDVPFFDTVSVESVSTEITSASSLGGHLGVDGTFMYTEQLGFGGFFRYSVGSVDIPVGNRNISASLGGTQLGAGVRVFF